MKVIIAEAGTDPTTTPLKSKVSGGLPTWVEENKVLVLAVLIFLVVTAARIIPREAPSSSATPAATQIPTAVVATPAIATEPPGACVGGPPGEWSGFHENGIYENGVLFVLQVEPRFTARCEDGTWEFSFK